MCSNMKIMQACTARNISNSYIIAELDSIMANIKQAACSGHWGVTVKILVPGNKLKIIDAGYKIYNINSRDDMCSIRW